MQCETLGCLNFVTAAGNKLCEKCLSNTLIKGVIGFPCSNPKCGGFTDESGKFCKNCKNTIDLIVKKESQESELPSVQLHETVKKTSSGGDNDYWVVVIDDPKRLAPYKAECEDLIEKFQFNFAEGEAFKALWRKGMANLGNGKPDDTPLRNAEKVAYMGSRMVVIEQRKLKLTKESA